MQKNYNFPVTVIKALIFFRVNVIRFIPERHGQNNSWCELVQNRKIYGGKPLKGKSRISPQERRKCLL